MFSFLSLSLDSTCLHGLRCASALTLVSLYLATLLWVSFSLVFLEGKGDDSQFCVLQVSDDVWHVTRHFRSCNSYGYKGSLLKQRPFANSHLILKQFSEFLLCLNLQMQQQKLLER